MEEDQDDKSGALKIFACGAAGMQNREIGSRSLDKKIIR